MKVATWLVRYGVSVAFTALAIDPTLAYAPWPFPVKLLYVTPVGILASLLVWIAIDTVMGNPPFWTGREVR